MKPKITFYGGTGSVTGASFLFDIGSKKILVDCGLKQGSREDELENREPFPFDPKSIDILFVTHAHADHIGRIPKLVKDGFSGKIISNPATKSLAEIMFADALSIMKINALQDQGAMFYDASHVAKALSVWETLPYHTKFDLGDGFSVYAKDAGHILGSTMYEFSRGDRTIVFTGDLGNSPSPLLRDTESVSGANYIVMESVYGDRNHESKDDRDANFKKIIEDTIAGNRTLLIPSFSLERTQVLLYKINNLFESGEMKSIPVFLDSPLAIKVTEIYSKISNYFKDSVRDEIAQGDDIFDFPKLQKTARIKDSQGIVAESNPKIIIAGSGMSAGGRILSHEIMYAPDPNATILLVGYQSVGTIGRQLEEGVKVINIKGERVIVRAKIEKIEGFSSHKDSNGLVSFVETAGDSLEKVFVAMGEPKSGLFLVQRLRDELGVKAVFPEEDSVHEIDI